MKFSEHVLGAMRIGLNGGIRVLGAVRPVLKSKISVRKLGLHTFFRKVSA